MFCTQHKNIRNTKFFSLLTIFILFFPRGLTILQELNLSDSRRSPFTEAALDRILDSNLSAKYSLTGILREENIITDGFYDAGKVKNSFEQM